MKEFYFEKLVVWQESRVFVKDIYLITKSFPSEEKYSLVSQVRRAALSIPANISEGMYRMTEKDKARFINQAFASAMETINFLILANDLKLLNDEDYLYLRQKLEKIANQLNSLYNKFEK